MLPVWCFIVMLVYGAPTILLYIMILLRFHLPSTRNLFQGAFFKISTAIGIVDILAYLNSYPDLKMPLCVFFADTFWGATPGYWINICVFLVYYLNYTREYLLVANAANRLTALMFPHKHDFVSFKLIRTLF